MRCRHLSEHPTFPALQSSSPCDREPLLQYFERILPRVVQHVCGSKARGGQNSSLVVPRPLRAIHRLSGMPQGARSFECDLTVKDAQAVRDPERQQLLRSPRQLDHPVELGATFSRMSREGQSDAVEKRKAEARAEPNSIGPEA